MIIPGLLRYGVIDEPTHLDECAYEKMVRDVMDIVDIEGTKTILSIGHDWDSLLDSLLFNYYPD